jgi:hypothetical protein
MSMFQFRLWILAGSILATLLVGGFRNLVWPPSAETTQHTPWRGSPPSANEQPPD